MATTVVLPAAMHKPEDAAAFAETLFTSKTVDEINDWRKACSAAIRATQEELRSAIGKQYRELIDCCDSVSGMASVCDDITQLAQQQSLGGKGGDAPSSRLHGGTAPSRSAAPGDPAAFRSSSAVAPSHLRRALLESLDSLRSDTPVQLENAAAAAAAVAQQFDPAVEADTMSAEEALRCASASVTLLGLRRFTPAAEHFLRATSELQQHQAMLPGVVARVVCGAAEPLFETSRRQIEHFHFDLVREIDALCVDWAFRVEDSSPSPAGVGAPRFQVAFADAHRSLALCHGLTVDLALVRFVERGSSAVGVISRGRGDQTGRLSPASLLALVRGVLRVMQYVHECTVFGVPSIELPVPPAVNHVTSTNSSGSLRELFASGDSSALSIDELIRVVEAATTTKAAADSAAWEDMEMMLFRQLCTDMVGSSSASSSCYDIGGTAPAPVANPLQGWASPQQASHPSVSLVGPFTTQSRGSGAASLRQGEGIGEEAAHQVAPMSAVRDLVTNLCQRLESAIAASFPSDLSTNVTASAQRVVKVEGDIRQLLADASRNWKGSETPPIDLVDLLSRIGDVVSTAVARVLTDRLKVALNALRIDGETFSSGAGGQTCAESSSDISRRVLHAISRKMRRAPTAGGGDMPVASAAADAIPRGGSAASADPLAIVRGTMTLVLQRHVTLQDAAGVTTCVRCVTDALNRLTSAAASTLIRHRTSPLVLSSEEAAATQLIHQASLLSRLASHVEETCETLRLDSTAISTLTPSIAEARRIAAELHQPWQHLIVGTAVGPCEELIAAESERTSDALLLHHLLLLDPVATGGAPRGDDDSMAVLKYYGAADPVVAAQVVAFRQLSQPSENRKSAGDASANDASFLGSDLQHLWAASTTATSGSATVRYPRHPRPFVTHALQTLHAFTTDRYPLTAVEGNHRTASSSATGGSSRAAVMTNVVEGVRYAFAERFCNAAAAFAANSSRRRLAAPVIRACASQPWSDRLQDEAMIDRRLREQREADALLLYFEAAYVASVCLGESASGHILPGGADDARSNDPSRHRSHPPSSQALRSVQAALKALEQSVDVVTWALVAPFIHRAVKAEVEATALGVGVSPGQPTTTPAQESGGLHAAAGRSANLLLCVPEMPRVATLPVMTPTPAVSSSFSMATSARASALNVPPGNVGEAAGTSDRGSHERRAGVNEHSSPVDPTGVTTALKDVALRGWKSAFNWT